MGLGLKMLQSVHDAARHVLIDLPRARAVNQVAASRMESAGVVARAPPVTVIVCVDNWCDGRVASPAAACWIGVWCLGCSLRIGGTRAYCHEELVDRCG